MRALLPHRTHFPQLATWLELGEKDHDHSSLGGPLHDHFATTFGLHKDSTLNSSFFHATEGLVPDIMHDCLEGCLQYEIKE